MKILEIIDLPRASSQPLKHPPPYPLSQKSFASELISKYLLPAIKAAGWDDLTQTRQRGEAAGWQGVVRGQMAARKKVKSADIVLNLPANNSNALAPLSGTFFIVP